MKYVDPRIMRQRGSVSKGRASRNHFSLSAYRTGAGYTLSQRCSVGRTPSGGCWPMSITRTEKSHCLCSK